MRRPRRAARIVSGILLAALAGPMMYAVMQLPPPGRADAPAHVHVAANYIEQGARVGGADNLVTGILLNFRALDTFGEVIVILTAWLAVVAVAATAGPERRDAIRVSPVVDYVIRILGPFIATFALFVIVNGHVLPGGGFQGGVVLGAMTILLSLVAGPDKTEGFFSVRIWDVLRAAGALAFAIVALLGCLLTGHVLGMPDQPLVRGIMLMTLEFGIGIGGGAVLAGLFFAVFRHQPSGKPL